jgi:hypothetical protein
MARRLLRSRRTSPVLPPQVLIRHLDSPRPRSLRHAFTIAEGGGTRNRTFVGSVTGLESRGPPPRRAGWQTEDGPSIAWHGAAALAVALSSNVLLRGVAVT